MGLFSSVGSSISEFAPVIGRMLGTTVLHGVNTGGGLYARAQAVVTTTTAQSMTFKALRGYGDDFFNGWYAIGQECTAIAELEANPIANYTSTTGICTFTADQSGAPAVNDNLRLVPPEWVMSNGMWVSKATPSGATTPWVKNLAHRLFTVTGNVMIHAAYGDCTISLVGATTTAALGTAIDTAGLIASVTCEAIDVGDIWCGRGIATIDSEIGYIDAAPVILADTDIDIALSNNTDINPGGITFYIKWSPISAGAKVVPAVWD